MLVANVLALPTFYSHRSWRSRQPRLARAGLSVGPRGLHFGVNRRGMYTSAGIPGTGIYAVHHIRRSSGEHPKVAGSAWPVILLLAVLLFASGVKACA
jgi:hypothetical protein